MAFPGSPPPSPGPSYRGFFPQIEGFEGAPHWAPFQSLMMAQSSAVRSSSMGTGSRLVLLLPPAGPGKEVELEGSSSSGTLPPASPEMRLRCVAGWGRFPLCIRAVVSPSGACSARCAGIIILSSTPPPHLLMIRMKCPTRARTSPAVRGSHRAWTWSSLCRWLPPLQLYVSIFGNVLLCAGSPRRLAM